MQTESTPQHTPQEIHIVNLVPEQARPAMHNEPLDKVEKMI